MKRLHLSLVGLHISAVGGILMIDSRLGPVGSGHIVEPLLLFGGLLLTLATLIAYLVPGTNASD